MIDEPQIQFPLFYPAGTKAGWTALNQQANQLLGYANEGAQNYSNPIIDKFGEYWFTVNPEVQTLVDLTKCVEYSAIEFNQPLIK